MGGTDPFQIMYKVSVEYEAPSVGHLQEAVAKIVKLCCYPTSEWASVGETFAHLKSEINTNR